MRDSQRESSLFLGQICLDLPDFFPPELFSDLTLAIVNTASLERATFNCPSESIGIHTLGKALFSNDLRKCGSF